MEDFQHGGANLTGFRLVNPTHQRTAEIQREWVKFSPVLGQGGTVGNRRLQLEAALTIDAVTSLVKGLTALSGTEHGFEELRIAIRRGKVYNNGTMGVHCKPDSPVWKLGPAIMKNLREVSTLL